MNGKKKSSPINGHVELRWGQIATPCNTTVLRHFLALIPSALLTSKTLALQPWVAHNGTLPHVTQKAVVSSLTSNNSSQPSAPQVA